MEKGAVRQFVAMPLGEGYTAEEQLTGAGRHGGLQLLVCPMKRERYEALLAARPATMRDYAPAPAPAPCLGGMGLAPGGRMKQKIYDDPHGLDAWDQSRAARCFVTLANAAQWMALTGERPPTEPPSARRYARAGLPWFDYYGGDRKALSGSRKLGMLASVMQALKRKGESPPMENESFDAAPVVGLRAAGANRVREFPAGDAPTQ